MATLVELYSLVNGMPELQQRFLAARVKLAWDILNESSGTTNHAARLGWANKVIVDFSADGDEEYRRFLSNATIQTVGNGASDNDILFVVSSFVDTYAGA